MPFVPRVYRFIGRVLSLPAAAILLSGCTTKMLPGQLPTGSSAGGNVNAEGFGGGGRTDAARSRLITTFERFDLTGVSNDLCVYSPDCEQNHSQLLCQRVRNLASTSNGTRYCRDSATALAGKFLSTLRKTPIINADNQLSIPDPNGGSRMVDAWVPPGCPAIYITKNVIAESNDETLTAILGHEIGHCVNQLASDHPVGDFEEIINVEMGRDYLDAFGAALAIQTNPSMGDYPSTVLSDRPLAYYKFDENEDSTGVWDYSGHKLHGSYLGEVEKALTPEPSLNLNASLGFAGKGAITFPLTGIDNMPAGGVVTVEMWMMIRATSQQHQTLFSFRQYGLALEGSLIGFSRGAGDIYGVDLNADLGINAFNRDMATNTNRWIHLVAKFAQKDMTASRLYIDGVELSLHQVSSSLTYGSFSDTSKRSLYRSREELGNAARLSGTVGNNDPLSNVIIDELSIYTQDLSKDRILKHSKPLFKANESYWATVQYADVNGDGRTDACARTSAGIYCAVSDGTNLVRSTRWSTDFGFDSGFGSEEYYWGTLRFPDVNGDGKSDVCGRSATGIVCALANSSGTKFLPATLWTTDFSDAQGTHLHESYWRSIQYVFLDSPSDKMADVCGRRVAGIFCRRSDGTQFSSIAAAMVFGDMPGKQSCSGYCPDDFSWKKDPKYWQTFQFSDSNSLGFQFPCARYSGGIACAFPDRNTFGLGTTHTFDFSDSAGWGDDPSYWKTLQFADVYGDGKPALCGRGTSGIVCARRGDLFTLEPVVGWTSNVFGDRDTIEKWKTQESYWSSIKYPDLNGDGAADVCGKTSKGIVCGLSNSSGQRFDNVGTWTTQFSDDASFQGAYGYWRSIGYPDINGDKRADICGSSRTGFVCQTSNGSKFEFQ